MATRRTRIGESRWPAAAAVLLTGVLRITLPPQLRLDEAGPVLFVLLFGLVIATILMDRGRIDRRGTWRRVLTVLPIALITIANGGSTVRLIYGILFVEPFTQQARTLLAAGGVIWLTNVIAFALWYWDLDRGGAAARALGSNAEPAFLFPEMLNPAHVRRGWRPTFVDYLHFSVNTAMAFSPTDVSAIKPGAKLMMMAEELISVVVGILVVARAVNILKLLAGYHRWQGEVLEQSACDDPGMDKIMVCVGSLPPYDQKESQAWPARSDGNGKQEPAKTGRDRPGRPHAAVPGLRRPAGSWITKYR